MDKVRPLKFECEIAGCKYRTNSKEYLAIHALNHTIPDYKTAHTGEIDKGFPGIAKKISKPKFSCPVEGCSKKYAKKCSVKVHMSRDHNENAKLAEINLPLIDTEYISGNYNTQSVIQVNEVYMQEKDGSSSVGNASGIIEEYQGVIKYARKSENSEQSFQINNESKLDGKESTTVSEQDSVPEKSFSIENVGQIVRKISSGPENCCSNAENHTTDDKFTFSTDFTSRHADIDQKEDEALLLEQPIEEDVKNYFEVNGSILLHIINQIKNN